jgi:DNA (cytosine-5)-methyltransferase 1
MNDYFGMVINSKEIIPTFTVDDVSITLDNLSDWFNMGQFITNYTVCLPNYLKKILKGRYDNYIPEWIQDAPKIYIQEFINGFISSFDKNIIITDSVKLAYELQRLYLKLGYISSIEKILDRNPVKKYKIIIKENKLKSDTSFIEDNYVWFKPYRITRYETVDEPVYNFEVENDNSYIVYNTIVHNCQGFSNAGKKRSDDPRNELVNEFARVVRIVQPEWIIGENVVGLLSRKGRDPITNKMIPVIEIIKGIFSRIGYNITYKVLKASDVGVPQERKRLIIIGCPVSKGYPHMPWDKVYEIASGKGYSCIRSFLENHLKDAMEFPIKNIPDDLSPLYWIETNMTEVSGTPHPNLVRLVNGIRNKSTKEKVENPDSTEKSVIHPNGLISFGVRKSSYHGQVLNPDTTSKTIICTYGLCPRLFVGLYNPHIKKYWIRCLSINELAQIQGFPNNYKWAGNEKDIITQIGNAVPPLLCYSVVKTLPSVTFEDSPQVISDITDSVSDDEDDE